MYRWSVIPVNNVVNTVIAISVWTRLILCVAGVYWTASESNNIAVDMATFWSLNI